MLLFEKSINISFCHSMTDQLKLGYITAIYVVKTFVSFFVIQL